MRSCAHACTYARAHTHTHMRSAAFTQIHESLSCTGMLDIGPGKVFEGARNSARLHNLRHEELTGAEVNRRFPGKSPPPTPLFSPSQAPPVLCICWVNLWGGGGSLLIPTVP